MNDMFQHPTMYKNIRLSNSGLQQILTMLHNYSLRSAHWSASAYYKTSHL